MKILNTIRRPVVMCLLIGVLTSLLILPTGAARERNMFTNGDFQNGMSGWQTWTNDPNGASVRISSDEGVDGTRCLVMKNTKPVANSLFQFPNCRQGNRYMVTCDVRYENIGTEGQGFCIGNAAYDAAGNNIGETLSASVFGTSEDWRTVSFIFEVTNDPARMNAGPRLWFSTGTVYIDNVKMLDITETKAESGSYDLTLSDTPNRHTVNSLGVEWDPKMLLPINLENGITEDDLDFIKSRIDALGLQAVRMMITPDWFEKENDNDDPAVANPAGFDFDNPEMKSVFAYLKVCEELGIRVTLTWWGAPTGCWLACENTGDWIGAPNNLDEMAENIAYLLGYIRNDLGYSCVKELILQNEPSYSFKVDGGAVDFNYYVAYYKTVQARLTADGMEDIVLVGADDSQDAGWFLRAAEALPEICGKFNSHNYAWSYDMPYLDILIQEFVSARTSASGDIPFYLGEFGDGSTVGAYVATSTETHGRGIYVASVVVNAFKAGAAGASYWPLHDIYYYAGDPNGGDNGGLMSQGLIGFKKDGAWSYRPTYYAYGLLCNAIPFGSEIYDIKGDTAHVVDAVAVKTPEGRWSIIAVNRSAVEQTIHVTAPSIGTKLASSVYAEGILPTDGSMITPSATVTPAEGIYSLNIPAEGIVVLSNIGMSDEEMALPGTETESESVTDTETETAIETTVESTSTADSESAAESETLPESNTETVTETVTETESSTTASSETGTEPAATDAATGSTAGSTTTSAAETTDDDGSGCSSAMAGAALVLTAIPAALLVQRKREK